MSDNPTILDVRNLTVELNQPQASRRILDNVSLSVRANEVLGIIGETSSGKTVLSRALVNWIAPPLRKVSGELIYRGVNLEDLPAAEMQRLRGRKIAYIGADPTSALDPTLPVGRQIVEKLKAVEPGITEAAARARVLATLDAVRIPSAARRFDEFPFQFSGGMMQRVMIVDALVTSPDLLVADNITQPLDVTVAAQILRLLKELQSDYNTAILFVSSLLGMVNEIADNVLVLAQGKVVERQNIANLLNAPQHLYTKNLVREMPRIWAPAAVTPPSRQGGASNDTVLSVQDVHKTYVTKDRTKLMGTQKVQAVRGVSFEVQRGDSLGIVGESGCGKSSLSRLLSRLEPTDQGEIRFKGERIADVRGAALLNLRRKFQLLLQDPYNSIPNHMTIGRTIAEPLVIHGGLSRAEIREKVAATMAEVGLASELTNALPVGLSAGQRQRVNIARAMVLEPELLILDETLSALDQVEQSKLLALFDTLQAKHGITYIYISHDLGMVRRACNKVAVMYLGRVVELAENDTIFFNPSHPYTRALLSAVPAVEPRPYAATTYLMEGEPPNPIDIPKGCSFKSRCPFAFDRCAVEDPHLSARGPADYAACHLEPRRLPVLWHGTTPTPKVSPATPELSPLAL